MRKIYVTLNKEAITDEKCKEVMIYIADLVDDVLNKSEIIAHTSWNMLLGSIASLELLGIINTWDADELLNSILKEKHDDIL